MKIGINLPDSPDPDYIRDWLRAVCDAGFEHAEFNIGNVPLMVNGELEYEWIEYLKKLFSEFPITYSAHIGPGLDCRAVKNSHLHKKVLLSSVIAAGKLKMSPLVLHYEKKSDSDLLEEQFFNAHYEAAEVAKENNVLLCLENIEVEYVDPVIETVKRINHPNMKMTYDIGHGFLASKYLGFDYLDSIKKSLPYLGHLHLSDNAGEFEELRITNRSVYDNLDMKYRFAYGSGDIHIPPLWGAIPYREVEEVIRGFEGVALCEFYSDYYKPFLSKIYNDVNNLLNLRRV